MKKWFRGKWKRIGASIILIISCTACGEAQGEHLAAVQTVEESVADEKEPVKTVEESTIEKAEIVQTEEETATVSSEEGKKEVEWDVDFEMTRESYHYNEQRNDINIYYPQLAGLEDGAKEERINALIEEDVKKLIGEKNKEGDDTLYCLTLDYEVKFLNDRIISILYKGRRGYIMPGRARMPGIVMATTIDLEEEKVIALKDVADISKLGDMLLSDEFENITMWEGRIPEFEASTVIAIYEDGLVADLQERHSWYMDGEHFVIVLADPKYFDYLEYSIDIELVSHILDETFLQKVLGQIDGIKVLDEQEEQSDMLMSGEEFDRIMKCLDEQVPEIWNEWADYVKDVSKGEAHIYERIAGEYLPEDVYRDYQKTEYLGKYYCVYVGEMWEDHSVNWVYFYVSENFDEVLWYDHIARMDNEYPVLYLDEWRNSDYYPKLGK